VRPYHKVYYQGGILLNKKVLVEGILLFFLSLMGIAEGYRLIIEKDPYLVYGAFEPGVYILAFSFLLTVAGISHFMVHYKDSADILKKAVDKKLKIRMIVTVGIFAAYIMLIPIISYPIATFLFFVFEFRVIGVKPWRFCFLLALIMAICCYFIFIKYCNVVFPRGILEGILD
jgi:MFS family permease